MLGYRQVTRCEFFAMIGPQNVHPQIMGPYPYTSIFKTPNGLEVGRIDNQGRYLLANK